MPSDMSFDKRRLEALGRVVAAASMMDEELRLAFTAFLGTEYAAVVAAGQATSWLIVYCRALAKVHKHITKEGRERIKEALDKCEAASQKRNRLVHGLWATSAGQAVSLQSKRHTHFVGHEYWTVEQIDDVTNDLFDAYTGLGEPIVAELGMTSMTLGWKLRGSDQTDLPPDLLLIYYLKGPTSSASEESPAV